jgi:hypothetical protein
MNLDPSLLSSSHLSSFSPRPRWAAAVFSCLFAAAACSSHHGAASESPSDAGPSGEAGPVLDALFTDPGVPRCDSSALYKVAGKLDGMNINVSTFLLSNLDPNGFQILEVANGNVRTDLGLAWTAPLAENAALPVTGGSIRIPDGQPLGGKTYCITAGKFGSPTPAADGGGSRQLLFQITGARDGDCNGASVDVSLSGCDWRSNSYFPVPPPSDAGTD